MEKLPEKRKETTPGIGESGLVICPLMKNPCMKHGCEWWIELSYPGEEIKKVARCSVAWLSLLSTEVRASIDNLKQGVKNDKVSG